MADRIVVVEGPARGDGIQAEKAGLLELADIVLVNKADLMVLNATPVNCVSRSLDGDDAPEVLLTSGLKGLGIPEAASALLNLNSSGRARRAGMRERLLGNKTSACSPPIIQQRLTPSEEDLDMRRR